MIKTENDKELYKKYRESHPRCSYCRFCRCKFVDFLGDIYTCELKDKNIQLPTVRRFCKWFRCEDNM